MGCEPAGSEVVSRIDPQSGRYHVIMGRSGGPIEKWLNIELPKVQNLRMDLLGQTAGGGLVHVELQSGNDAAMPLRMAEYCLGVLRLFAKFPRQVLLYVGEAPLRMASELRGPALWFEHRTMDIRELDGDSLLESEETGDNVIAILARLRDRKEAIRKMQKVPVYIDLLENKVLGPAFRRGELTILRRLIEKRFGAIPSWAEERLTSRSQSELEELSERILDAPSMEDLL
jgi:hypothetical protein